MTNRFATPGKAAGGALLLLGLALALAGPALARVLHVYEVQHRLAEELAPLVGTVLGDGGSVVADPRTNSLVLSGERDAVRDALALLEQLDARLRTVVLRYVSEDASSLASRGVRVDWRLTAGDFRIGSLSHPAKHAEDGVAVRVGEREIRSESTHESMLRILEGESGRIATGVSAPLTTRRILPGRRGAVVHETTQLVSAESGFEARPRILGDGRIELALRPFHDRLGPDGRIETAGAETRLVVTPGETVVLGSVDESARSTSRELPSGVSREERADARWLLITATLE